jgi:hypothetical protein
VPETTNHLEGRDRAPSSILRRRRTVRYIVVMRNESHVLRDLSNDQLEHHVQQLVRDERTATVRLIAALAEFDARRLYLAQGCSSLFMYCTRVLALSEHAAYGRIEAARAAQRYPVVLEFLDAGEITLTTISLLAARLTAGNHRALLELTRRKSRREVEQLLAALEPRPDLPSLVLRHPERTSGSDSPAPSAAVASGDVGGLGARGAGAGRLSEPKPLDPATAATEPQPPAETAASSTQPAAASVGASRPPLPTTAAPLSPGRYRLHITVSAETYGKLRRALDLMRHAVPDGDPAVIVDRALTLLVQTLERRKLAMTASAPASLPAASAGENSNPGAGPSTADQSDQRSTGDRGTPRRSRYIPAGVRRAVWARDGGQCAFVGTFGRCTEHGWLEFHHRRPYAAGGATSVHNLELRCRAHNLYDAELFFGSARTAADSRSAAPASARGGRDGRKPG